VPHSQSHGLSPGLQLVSEIHDMDPKRADTKANAFGSNRNQTVESPPGAMMDDRLMQPHGARDELIKSSLLNCFKIVPENAEEATQLAKRQQSSDQPVPVPEAGRLVRREARLVQSNEFKVVAR
jgi:hypothetical protein